MRERQRERERGKEITVQSLNNGTSERITVQISRESNEWELERVQEERTCILVCLRELD